MARLAEPDDDPPTVDEVEERPKNKFEPYVVHQHGILKVAEIAGTDNDVQVIRMSGR